MGSIYGMTTAPNPVTASDRHAVNTDVLQRLGDSAQTFVKNVEGYTAPGGLVGDVFKVCSGQVGKEHLALAGRLAPNHLREISDSKVDRIGRLVAKAGDLCLVGGNDQGDDSSTRLVLLQLLL